MVRTARAAWVVVGVAAVLAWFESAAQACSGSDCFGPRVVPGSDGVVMPVNAVGVAWYSGDGNPDEVALVDVEADVALAFTIADAGSFAALLPDEPLEPGREYRFDIPAGTCGPGFGRSFLVGEAVEGASVELGLLLANAPEYGKVPVPESPSCTVDVPAISVRVEIELAAEVEPLAEVLMYTTLVDGEPWSHQSALYWTLQFGESWVGRGVDQVFATCPGGGSDGVSLGTHEVQMVARIPGLPDEILKSDVVEIELVCPDESDDDDAGDDDSSGAETGSFVIPIDDADDRSGCACTSEGAGPPAETAFAAIALLLLGRRRRATSSSW